MTGIGSSLVGFVVALVDIDSEAVEEAVSNDEVVVVVALVPMELRSCTMMSSRQGEKN